MSELIIKEANVYLEEDDTKRRFKRKIRKRDVEDMFGGIWQLENDEHVIAGLKYADVALTKLQRKADYIEACVIHVPRTYKKSMRFYYGVLSYMANTLGVGDIKVQATTRETQKCESILEYINKMDDISEEMASVIEDNNK